MVSDIDFLNLKNHPGSGKIQSGSGALGLKEDVGHQKYEKKNGY